MRRAVTELGFGVESISWFIRLTSLGAVKALFILHVKLLTLPLLVFVHNVDLPSNHRLYDYR